MKIAARLLLTGCVLAWVGTLSVRAQSESNAATTAPRLVELERDIERPPQQLAQKPAVPARSASLSRFEEVGRFRVPLLDSAVRGSRSAKLALIEYSDFQCPYCARHAQTIYPELQRRFINTGKLLYVFRHLPLEHSHPLAVRAGQAAECAGEHGKFWEMHDLLFGNQQALGEIDLSAHARSLGIATEDFVSCLEKDTIINRVRRDAAHARQIGARMTPTFFLGTIDRDGVVEVSRKINGAQPLSAFEAALDTLSETTLK
jgi:protein-disulfide isomerase